MHTINDLVLYRDHILYTPSKTESNSMTMRHSCFQTTPCVERHIRRSVLAAPSKKDNDIYSIEQFH